LTSVAATNTHFYLSTTSNRLLIYDHSQGSKPMYTRSIHTKRFGPVQAIALTSAYIIATEDTGTYLWDLENPTVPLLMFTACPDGTPVTCLYSFNDDSVFVGYESGVVV
jgi:hypothetical protein